MANPIKGEVPIELDGKSYTLLLDANRIVEAETLLDKGVADFDLRRTGTQRALLWAALQHHHPEITLLDAGDLMTGHMSYIGEKIGEALRAAFPPQEVGGDARPRKAGRGGTGKAS